MLRSAVLCFALTFAVLSSFPTSAFAQDAPLRVGGAIQPPKKIKHVDPVYPVAAQAARIEGVVILEMTIAENGTVTDARVLRSIPELDRAAVDAVLQWQFTPTLLNGVPQSIIYTVTVAFSLDRAANSLARESAPGRVTLFADGAQAVFDIPLERIASLPRWIDPSAGPPPLPSNQAADIAATWARQQWPGAAPQLNDITLRSEDSANGRVWFYVTRFSTSGATLDAAKTLVTVVLLDGSVVEPNGGH